MLLPLAHQHPQYALSSTHALIFQICLQVSVVSTGQLAQIQSRIVDCKQGLVCSLSARGHYFFRGASHWHGQCVPASARAQQFNAVECQLLLQHAVMRVLHGVSCCGCSTAAVWRGGKGPIMVGSLRGCPVSMEAFFTAAAGAFFLKEPAPALEFFTLPGHIGQTVGITMACCNQLGQGWGWPRLGLTMVIMTD